MGYPKISSTLKYLGSSFSALQNALIIKDDHGLFVNLVKQIDIIVILNIEKGLNINKISKIAENLDKCYK